MEIDQQHWSLIERWYNGYIDSYGEVQNQTKYMFELKKKHSYRVSQIMYELASSSTLSPSETILSRIIGLVHDVGRFPQYIKYGTFNDRLSVDHGQLAVEVLKQNTALTYLPEEIQSIINNAIINHNKEEISENLTTGEQRQAELIRDADKLDILAFALPIFEDGVDVAKKLLLSWSNVPEITPEVAQSFLSGTTVNHSKLKTVQDYKISLMAWIFDFNTPAARKMFTDKKYLQKISATLAPGPLKDEILKYNEQHLINHD